MERVGGDVVFEHFGELQLKGIHVECPLLFRRYFGECVFGSVVDGMVGKLWRENFMGA